MRTMLTLVLFCSLVQLAAAQGRGAPRLEQDHRCGTTYKCYVPKMCNDDQPADANGNPVIEISEPTDQLYSDCAALIKFHSYAKNWVHVSIESYVETVNSITFTITGDKPAVFSCKRATPQDAAVGGYSPLKTFTKAMERPTGKILCTFDVKLPSDKEILNNGGNSGVNKGKFDIDVQATIASFISPYNPRCDPSNFKFVDPHDKSVVHRQLKSKPEYYYCDDPDISKIEYQGTSIESRDMICTDDKFVVGRTTVPKGTTMEIRCAADVKYFCDSDQVKEVKGTNLERQKADKILKIESSLKCPTTKPHLFVKDKPVFNEKIKCVNYGGSSQLWTVGQRTLTANGPEIYCSDILECRTMLRIPESAVDGGTLNAEFLPKCHTDGVLQDANGAVIVNAKVTCDTSTGNYTYFIGTEKKIVQKDTKFMCYHAPRENSLVDKQNKETVTIGSIAAGATAGIIIMGIVVGLTFFARRKIRIRNAKAAEMDRKLFEAFATNKEEKDALKQPKKDSTHVKDNIGKNSDWNETQLAIQYEAVCSLSTGRTDGKYESPNESGLIDKIPSEGKNVPLAEKAKLKAKEKRKRDDVEDEVFGIYGEIMLKKQEKKQNKQKK